MIRLIWIPWIRRNILIIVIHLKSNFYYYGTIITWFSFSWVHRKYVDKASSFEATFGKQGLNYTWIFTGIFPLLILYSRFCCEFHKNAQELSTFLRYLVNNIHLSSQTLLENFQNMQEAFFFSGICFATEKASMKFVD